MGSISALQAQQLGTAFAQMGMGAVQPNSPQGRLAQSLYQTGQGGVQTEYMKEQKKKAEKKKKSGVLGKIGSTLGTIGGVALAPLTGGASLAATTALGAAGSAVGGMAGEALGGGGFSTDNLLGYGVSGALGGFVGGGGLGKLGIGAAETGVAGAAAPKGAVAGAGVPTVAGSGGTGGGGLATAATQGVTAKATDVAAIAPWKQVLGDAVPGLAESIYNLQRPASTLPSGGAWGMSPEQVTAAQQMEQQDNITQQQSAARSRAFVAQAVEGEKDRASQIKLQTMKFKNDAAMEDLQFKHEERMAKLNARLDQQAAEQEIHNVGANQALVTGKGNEVYKNAVNKPLLLNDGQIAYGADGRQIAENKKDFAPQRPGSTGSSVNSKYVPGVGLVNAETGNVIVRAPEKQSKDTSGISQKDMLDMAIRLSGSTTDWEGNPRISVDAAFRQIGQLVGQQPSSGGGQGGGGSGGGGIPPLSPADKKRLSKLKPGETAEVSGVTIMRTQDGRYMPVTRR